MMLSRMGARLVGGHQVLPLATHHGFAIPDLDPALGQGGDGRVVGHEQQGVALPVQLAEEIEHLGACLGIQRACGFVRQQEGGSVGQGPGHGHPLFLPSGEGGRQLVRLVGDAHLLQQGQGPLAALPATHARVEHGQLHIAHDARLGQEVVALEDEADLLVADPGQLAAREPLDLSPVERVGAGRGEVQAAQDGHEGGFAGSRGADEGHELALLHREVDAPEGVDRRPVGPVDLGETASLDDGRAASCFRHLSRPSSCWDLPGSPGRRP